MGARKVLANFIAYESAACKGGHNLDDWQEQRYDDSTNHDRKKYYHYMKNFM